MADHLTGLGGKSILTMKVSFQDISSSMRLSRKIIEFGGSIQQQFLRSQERPAVFELEFLLFDRDEMSELEEFFIAVKGKWGGFWLPSPVTFFTLTEDHFTSESTLRIQDNGYLKVFRGFERVYIKKRDGSLLTYKIDTVVQGPGPDQITLEIDPEALNQDVPLSQLDIISLLYYVRFDSDELVLDAQADDKARVKISVSELVKEYPA